MIEFESAGEQWAVDDEFLASNWTCIWGRGCLGIGDEIDPTHHLGCCSLGAELSDANDAARVAAFAACLSDERWQFADAARDGGIFTDETRSATRVVEGACIFLNRAGFDGGAGCALHLGALDDGDPPHDWKPEVCWELPVKLEVRTADDGTVHNLVRPWARRDFGSDGPSMAWFCTDTADAYVGEAPVIESLAVELREIVGAEVFVEIERRVDIAQRRGRRPSR